MKTRLCAIQALTVTYACTVLKCSHKKATKRYFFHFQLCSDTGYFKTQQISVGQHGKWMWPTWTDAKWLDFTSQVCITTVNTITPLWLFLIFTANVFKSLWFLMHQFNSLEVVFDISWTFFLRSSLCVITSYFIALLFWDFLQWAKAGDLKLVSVKFMGNHEAHMWMTSFEEKTLEHILQ